MARRSSSTACGPSRSAMAATVEIQTRSTSPPDQTTRLTDCSAASRQARNWRASCPGEEASIVRLDHAGDLDENRPSSAGKRRGKPRRFHVACPDLGRSRDRRELSVEGGDASRQEHPKGLRPKETLIESGRRFRSLHGSPNSSQRVKSSRVFLSEARQEREIDRPLMARAESVHSHEGGAMLRKWLGVATAVGVLAATLFSPVVHAQAEPIRIGFLTVRTGALAAGGRQ